MGVIHEQRETIRSATVRIVTPDNSPGFGIYSGPPSTMNPNTNTPRHLLIPASLLPSPDAKTVTIERDGKQHIADVIDTDPSGRIVHCHMPAAGAELLEHPPYDVVKFGAFPELPVCIPPAEGKENWPTVTASAFNTDDPAVIRVDAPHELPIGSPIVTNTGQQLVAIVIGSEVIDGKPVTLAILPSHTGLAEAPPQIPPGTKTPGFTYTEDIFAKQHAERESVGYGVIDPNFKPPTVHIQDACPKEIGRDGKPIPRHFSGSMGS